MNFGMTLRAILFLLGCGGIGAVLLVFCGQAAEEPKKEALPKPLPLDEALKKARAGKYAMLLRQVAVPKDVGEYKEFRDFGYRNLREYAGSTDLPAGHWVYVYPYWYIWRDLAAAPVVKRAWGPEQATGEPDTDMEGDFQTAWASLTEDGQEEWLLCEYADPVVPSAVLIHETYNPGAVFKVSAFKLDGTEVEVWKGKDPTEPGSGKGVSVIPVKANFKTNRIKVYISSREVPGWNEIDAVGLRDQKNKTQWAAAIDASSTYAQPAVAVVMPDPLTDRVKKLEDEVKQLKATIEEMKRMMMKKKE